MSMVEVVRKRSFDLGIRKRGRNMSVLKTFYKLLIFVPVLFTMLFIHVYQPFKRDEVNCSMSLTTETPSPTRTHDQDATVVTTPLTSPILRSLSQNKSLPPLTIHVNEGRLGNQMFTFASLLGLSIANGRDLVVMPDNHYALSRYFDIDYPVLDDETFAESDPWEIENWLKDEDLNIPGTSKIIKGTLFPTSFTFFHHCREKVKEVFTFHPIVTRYVNRVLEDVKLQVPATEVFVGVHVRRGDYIKTTNGGWLRAFNGREVDDEFFRSAVQHFTGRYNNTVFLAVSDDRAWCEENLKKHGINLAPTAPGEEFDLALLAACNHTIITYGTYGFWGGYLSGGDVVYFDDFLQPGTKQVKDYFRIDKMYPEEWVGISSTPPGYWDNYVNPFYLD